MQRRAWRRTGKLAIIVDVATKNLDHLFDIIKNWRLRQLYYIYGGASSSSKIRVSKRRVRAVKSGYKLWLVKYHRSTAVEYAIVLNYMLEIARPDPYPDKYPEKINNHTAVGVDL